MSIRRNALMNIAAFVVIIAGMKAASSLIVPFLLALFLAIICLPVLVFFKRSSVPEPLALLIILSVMVGAWLLLLFILGSTLGEFTRSVPMYQERMRLLIGQGYDWLLTKDIVVDKSLLDAIFDPGKILKLVTGIMNSLLSIMKNLFFILLMFAFLIIEASGIPTKIRAVRDNRQDSLVSYIAIIDMVNRYIGIKAITSFVTGALIYAGLLFIGVDFPVLWGLLSFILNFVPTIGSLIAAIPAIFLCLIQLGPSHAVAATILFLVVNTIIGNIAEPRIMGQRVGLSTIVVLLSLIFWGWVLGPIGMLLSVPLTMAVKIALSENASTRWISLLLAPNSEISHMQNEAAQKTAQK